MPQLTPFFFLNQLSISFLGLFLLVILLSKLFLPQVHLLQLIRIYITKLSK
ncbi:ATP synthase F0 subunit 8 (mitochondrion) [Phanerochaete sordida]|uniref:ATP synthase protein 8 n=1 Tax=Phanerochaete sordida TaxID=48140 RepID=A0A9N7KY50_9APHY|nr:ATP synthase F0 subunit 8 [Phanerochaete sordida]